MARSTVGLDIGTGGVQVAEVSTVRGEPTLTNFGGVALPRGAVREGEVIDVAAVAEAVKQLMKDAGIRHKKVHIGVANQRVVVRQIDLPYMEESELQASLRFQVQEYIPIPVEDAELDFHPLEEFTGEGEARMLRVLLVAAHRDMVTSHVTAASEGGLRPQSVDLNSFAILRALGRTGAVGGSELIVDVGAGVTNIIVHEDGVPRFVRILVLGGEDITETVASGMQIPHEEAEELKQRTGLDRTSTETAARLIADRADDFVDEVRGSLDYYQAQTGSTRITRVVFSGGGSKLTGLRERLSDVLRLPVEMGQPLQHLPVKGTVYGPEQLAEVEPILTTAIGLALGGAR